jgi:hypothetical protein
VHIALRQSGIGLCILFLFLTARSASAQDLGVLPVDVPISLSPLPILTVPPDVKILPIVPPPVRDILPSPTLPPLPTLSPSPNPKPLSPTPSVLIPTPRIPLVTAPSPSPSPEMNLSAASSRGDSSSAAGSPKTQKKPTPRVLENSSVRAPELPATPALHMRSAAVELPALTVAPRVTSHGIYGFHGLTRGGINFLAMLSLLFVLCGSVLLTPTLISQGNRAI